MKFGYVLPHYPFELICENAILAEKIGFDSVWMTDHMLGVGIKRWHCLEAWSVLSGLSSKTQRVTLGACVTDPHRRHPAVLAQMVTTLDVMSGGRAVLGIGAGEAMNLDPYGISWDKPVSRLREAVTIIKRLWTENSVNYSGEFFKLKEAFLDPRPVQKPHPPIWIAANSPKTIRITAEMADGWIPTAVLMPPRVYAEKLGKIRDWARESRRAPSEIEPSIFLFTIAAEDEEEARKFAEFPARILLTFTPRLLKDYGVKLPSKELHISQFVFSPKTVKRLLEQMKEIPYEPIEELFAFGTPDHCISMLEEYAKAGVRHFLLNFLVPGKLSKSMITFYYDKVISYFME